MKKIVGLAFMSVIVLYAGAQKPAVDSGLYGKWPEVSSGAEISRDGKYATYSVGSETQGGSSFVVATDGSWRKELMGWATFTADSRRMVEQGRGNELALLTLGSDEREVIGLSANYKLSKNKETEWLAYQDTTAAKNLHLLNLRTGQRREYGPVDDYQFDEQGKFLLLQVKKDSLTEVQWADPGSETRKTIWTGIGPVMPTMDDKGEQLVFTAPLGREHPGSNACWYYRAGGDKAVLLTDGSKGVDPDVLLMGVGPFSPDGSLLSVTFISKERPAPKPDAVKLNVWSYTDPYLQPHQLEMLGPKYYRGMMDLRNGTMARLEEPNEYMEVVSDDLRWGMVVHSGGGAPGEMNWNRTALSTCYLVSAVDGKRRELPFKDETRYAFTFSPDAQYLVFFRVKDSNYYSYELSTGKVCKISGGLKVSLATSFDVRYGSVCIGIAGWMKDGSGICVYDQYDIWKLDPMGQRAPVNITNGYGRRHQYELRLLQDIYSPQKQSIPTDEKILLTAFSRVTKDNGFVAIVPGRKEPEQLVMGPCTYYAPQMVGQFQWSDGVQPMKAKDADVWLILRHSEKEAPNWFSTKDLLHLTALSDVHPERNYNWYTSELHTWTGLDGKHLQGVLYKPEDFDPHKKYPVIFYIYEIMSDNLHAYMKPEPASGPMNILWYVSHGYLVFMPDILYTIGDPFRSGYNSLVPAVAYLSKLPYVNGQKFGLQGQSFGGIQSYYLITHTHLFSAVCAASGLSDYISQYNYMSHGGMSGQEGFERGQERVGFTLWENPAWYIENSPVMHADRVTTPLLIFHNSVDGACPFYHGIEMFNALRRLNKKVWMLEYEEGNHYVAGVSAIDYSIRMAQFFDFYLKGKPAPVWMTRGIPAAMKGIENGLEYDTEMKEPGPGLQIVPSGGK